MTAKTLIAGSSFASGWGFRKGKNDPGFWAKLLHQEHGALQGTELINVSTAGRSNAGMFQDAVYHLLHDDVKYAFVAWASVPRYEMSLGLELYETRQAFLPEITIPRHNLNHINYTSEYLDKINKEFTHLAHPHYEIVNLLQMINALVKLAQRIGTKIIFVNTNCPWDQDYFSPMVDVLPNQLTPYTQKILNVDNRDDEEISKLYDKMHQEYQAQGGIQSLHWLNLYSSMRDTKVDSMKDGRHPGPKSNQLYFESFMRDLDQVLQQTA